MRRAALGLVLLTACAPRVLLPPLPSPTAPIEERQAAYRALAPVDQPEPVTSKSNGAVYPHKPYPFLSLGNGLEIWDPRDLSPAVLPGSPTAESITRFDNRRYYGGICMLAGAGLMLIGGGVGVAGFLSERGRFGAVTLSGVGVLLAGFVAITVGAFAQLFSLGSMFDAFKSYGGDLAAALGLPSPPPPQ